MGELQKLHWLSFFAGMFAYSGVDDLVDGHWTAGTISLVLFAACTYYRIRRALAFVERGFI